MNTGALLFSCDVAFKENSYFLCSLLPLNLPRLVELCPAKDSCFFVNYAGAIIALSVCEDR